MLIWLVIIVLSLLFYYLCIAGHNIYCFVDSIDHNREQRGKSSRLFWMNTIFLRFNSFHIFDALIFILQETPTLFSYYFTPDFSIQFGNHKIYIETKVRDRQQKTVLEFVLFWVVKHILCICNVLVSICLWVLNWCTQLDLTGSQYIERRYLLWLIFDPTSWILTGVSSHEYLIVLDMEFSIHHNKESGVRLYIFCTNMRDK